MEVSMAIEYKYAIIHIPTGFVWSRYRSRKQALKTFRNIDPNIRHEFKIVSIDDPVVMNYYEKVNRKRIMMGLPLINPRYPNPKV